MSRWANLVGLANQACLSLYGVPVTYTPAMETRLELAGIPVALTGIFDDRLEEVVILGDGGSGVPAVVPRQTLEIRIADLGFDPLAGDEVVIDGVAYRIQEVRTNGVGMASLHLVRRQNPFAGF